MSPSDAATRRRWVAPAVVIAAAALAYANTLWNGFVWDDHGIIVDNPTGHSLSNAWTVLTQCDAVGGPTPYYRPLSRLIYLFEYRLFGIQPWGYHLVSVLWHVAAALMLFVVARRLFRAELPAGFAALLLAVHPIATETVNFVSARNNVLAAAFGLAALAAYLRARDERQPAWYAASGVAFFLALLCKEPAMMLLPVLAALEAFSGASWRELVRRRAPVLAAFVGVAAVYLALRAVVLSSIGAPSTDVNVARGVVNTLGSVPNYLRVIVFPHSLTVAYERASSYLAHPAAIAAAWAAFAAAVFVLLRQGRMVTRLGIAWAALNFVPVSTLVWFPSADIAERYVYLPAIGAWLVAADQLWAAWERRPALRRLLASAAAAAVVALAARTVARNADWRDDQTLFASAVRTSPENADAHFNLGTAYDQAGDPERGREEWARAVALDPRNAFALSSLGTYHAKRRDYAGAERFFRAIVELDDTNALAQFNLALLLEKTGRPAEAVVHYRRFVETDREGRAELVARVRARIGELEGAVGDGRR